MLASSYLVNFNLNLNQIYHICLQTLIMESAVEKKHKANKQIKTLILILSAVNWLTVFIKIVDHYD